MHFKDGDEQIEETTPAFRATLLALAGLVILLGIFPYLLLYWFYF